MVAAAAAFGATLGRINNPDTLWHLAIGRWIFQHRTIPDINSFYYSTRSGAGPDYSWLSQLGLFVVHRLFGGTGVAVLSSLVAGLLFYFLYKTLERNSKNLLANMTVLTLALVTSTAYLSGRPAMFTVAFFALEIFLLTGFVQSRGRLIWLIPPLTALWTNLHAGFVIAPLAILLFIPLTVGARDRWTLSGCLLTAVAAAACNPYGWRIYLMPLEITRSLPMLRGLTEWTGISGWEAIIWGGIVAMVSCGLSLRRQPAPFILLGALAALAAGISNRNMPLFGVVAVLILGRTFLPLLGPALSRHRILRGFEVGFSGAGGWFWAVSIPVAIACGARLHALPVNLELALHGYPEDAVSYLESHACPDELFVRETWSGYVLWAAPNRRLFYDAKGGFSREATRAHAELVKPKSNWRPTADRYGISTFLLERGSPLSVVLSEAVDWRREYSDSLSEIYVRVRTGRGE